MTAWTNLVTSIFKKHKKTKKGGKPYSFKDALKEAKKVYKKNKTQKKGGNPQPNPNPVQLGGKKMKKGDDEEDKEKKRLDN
jgi:hypothetical protein